MYNEIHNIIPINLVNLIQEYIDFYRFLWQKYVSLQLLKTYKRSVYENGTYRIRKNG